MGLNLTPDIIYRHRPAKCCPHAEPCASPQNGPPPPGGYPGRRPTVFGASHGPTAEFGDGRRARRLNRPRRWGRALLAALLLTAGLYGCNGWQHANMGSCATATQECPR